MEAAVSPLAETDARALAHLMSTIRPDWDKAGCMSALRKVCDRELADVATAAISFTSRHDQRTPAALAQPGKHWTDTARPMTAEEAKAEMARPPRLDEIRCREHLQRRPCPGCAADAKAAQDDEPVPHMTAAEAIAAARAALRGDRP